MITELHRPETESVEYKPEAFNGSMRGKDFVSVEQFTKREELLHIFERASTEMRSCIENHEVCTMLAGHVATVLFYQESSRTFSSFCAAAGKLGAQVMPMHGMQAYSSAVKGESIADTVRTFEQTTAADLIILRHPEDDSSEIAAANTNIPIINAGSGRREHPTQAVLDLFTIQHELGRIDDLTVTMTGDLRNGRTIKSLAKLLAMAGNNIKINFVSPEVLQMPEDIISDLEEKGVKIMIGNNGDLDEAMQTSDILYVTRIQSEWFKLMAMEELSNRMDGLIDMEDQSSVLPLVESLATKLYKKAVHKYVIDQDRIFRNNMGLTVMHPLPRVGEIASDADFLPGAAYFRQMRRGLETRMAIIAEIMGR